MRHDPRRFTHPLLGLVTPTGHNSATGHTFLIWHSPEQLAYKGIPITVWSHLTIIIPTADAQVPPHIALALWDYADKPTQTRNETAALPVGGLDLGDFSL